MFTIARDRCTSTDVQQVELRAGELVYIVIDQDTGVPLGIARGDNPTEVLRLPHYPLPHEQTILRLTTT